MILILALKADSRHTRQYMEILMLKTNLSDKTFMYASRKGKQAGQRQKEGYWQQQGKFI